MIHIYLLLENCNNYVKNKVLINFACLIKFQIIKNIAVSSNTK